MEKKPGERINQNASGPAMVRVLLIHADWLRANGYKLQATSCRAQAASLTRKYYCSIRYYRRKQNENKRSKKNNHITVTA
jgi:hypothetical protein